MEQRQPHPMEALLIFTARELSKQYGEGATRQQFDTLISAAESSVTSDTAPSTKAEEDPPATNVAGDPPAGSLTS